VQNRDFCKDVPYIKQENFLSHCVGRDAIPQQRAQREDDGVAVVDSSFCSLGAAQMCSVNVLLWGAANTNCFPHQSGEQVSTDVFESFVPPECRAEASCYFPPLRKCRTKAKTWKFPDIPRDENEDEDVKAERLRVQEILSSPKSEEVMPRAPGRCPDPDPELSQSGRGLQPLLSPLLDTSNPGQQLAQRV